VFDYVNQEASLDEAIKAITEMERASSELFSHLNHLIQTKENQR